MSMEAGGILAVDDDLNTLTSYQMVLKSGGLGPVTVCSDPRQVPDLIRERRFTAILLDLAMPHWSGEEVLEHLRLHAPDSPVIIVTGTGDLETAIRCIRNGAHDYLVKPIDKNRLLTTVRRTTEASRLRAENQRLRDHLLDARDVPHPAFESMVTHDPAMRSVFRYIQAVGESPEPVLITGETGTGKDLCAEAAHRLSGRAGDYVAVNAAGLDEQMFNDVLFGHRRGAFTGATEAREGLFQKARGGTIFLDEIGDLPAPLQSKLLRVLESGEYYPAGCDLLSRTDARVVAATSRKIEELNNDTRFRRDLFYRLRIHHVHLPPLRDRTGDIPLLAGHFLETTARERNRAAPRLSDEAQVLLRGYSWPGNVRELKAIMLDLVNRFEGETVTAAHIRERLPADAASIPVAPIPTAGPGAPLPEMATAALPTIEQAVESLVNAAMVQSGDNQRRAAAILGISQPALSKRLRRAREKKAPATGCAAQ